MLGQVFSFFHAPCFFVFVRLLSVISQLIMSLQISKKRYTLPNPFNLGSLRRNLSEREAEDLYNTVK